MIIQWKDRKMKRKIVLSLIKFLFCLAIIAVPLSGGRPSVRASVPVGTIAYVRSDPVNGDEIHLIEPDGSGDRILYSTDVPAVPEYVDIQQLAWKPDATELAFTSSHEEDCSLFQSDIYTIRVDGSKYRRVSGPPACGSRSNLPTGTVKVELENDTYDNELFTIYFEGAPAPIDISLASGDATTVTFEDVADYGDQKQVAVAVFGEVRSFFPGADADVIPGQTVETGLFQISMGFEYWGFRWPTYLPDGSGIASIFNKGELYQVGSANQDPGLVGTKMTFDMPMSTDFLAWGPTPELADQFLYEGWVDGDTLFYGDINDEEGQVIMPIDPTRVGKTLLGLAWLPDGSGFLYSFSEFVNYVDKADMWEYSFDTGESTRLTDLSYGFIRRMTVSPDGNQIVYEVQQADYWYGENPSTDLWIMNRDGSGQALLVEGGRSPVWSPVDLPQPIVYAYQVFLPLIRKP